jgi:hypothetical protein
MQMDWPTGALTEVRSAEEAGADIIRARKVEQAHTTLLLNAARGWTTPGNGLWISSSECQHR